MAKNAGWLAAGGEPVVSYKIVATVLQALAKGEKLVGSTPALPTKYGRVAQSVERRLETPKAGGAVPPASTKIGREVQSERPL